MVVNLPLRPGQLVAWRNMQQVRAFGWVDAYGPGPFVVVRVVDRSSQELPAGLLLRTPEGVREVNALWLAPIDPAAAP